MSATDALSGLVSVALIVLLLTCTLNLWIMLALLVLFCAAQLFNPYLPRVEDKEWLDEMAAKRASGAP